MMILQPSAMPLCSSCSGYQRSKLFLERIIMKRTQTLGFILTTSVLCALGQSPAHSAPLNCKIVQSAPGLGTGHAEARAAISSDDAKLGFVATGGGCLLQPGAA